MSNVNFLSQCGTWNRHLDAIAEKTNKAVWSCREIVGENLKHEPENVYVTNKPFIEPKIKYKPLFLYLFTLSSKNI